MPIWKDTFINGIRDSVRDILVAETGVGQKSELIDKLLINYVKRFNVH